MAVTAKFDANFDSFYRAVDQATVKWKAFDAETSNVERDLNKMVDNFSGRKIISEATLVAEAVERIGGVSKLTAAELEHVGRIAAEGADKLRAWGQDVPANMQALANSVKGAGETAETTSGFFADLSGGILGIGAGFLSAQAVIGGVTRAFGLLTDFIGGSITAFADAEAANVKLQAALRQQSLATPAVISQYSALAATFQMTTRYSDDQIESMQALLTQVGGLMPSAMAGALQASTDLASGLGVDLQTATNLVAKAAAGHTGTLGRYGITVSEAALATKGFDAVLEAINRQFGGQAAADMETYSGKVAAMSNQWNNLQEAAGKAIVTNPLVVAAMRELTGAITKAGTEANATDHSLADFVSNITGAGPLVHGALVYLEEYAAGLNAVAQAQAMAARMPSPFKKIEDEGALPKITAGLKLFDEEVAANEKYHSAAAVKAREHAAAEKQLNDELEVLRDQAESMASLTGFRTAADDRQNEIIRQQTKAMNDLAVANGLRMKADQEFLDNELKIAKATDDANAKLGQLPPVIDKSKESFKGATKAAGVFMQQISLLVNDPAIAGYFGGGVQESIARTLMGSGVSAGEAAAMAACQFIVRAGVGSVQHRAGGGDVNPMSSYIVGEHGPELFSPSTSGFITPNGASGVTVHNVFHLVDTQAELARRVSDTILRTVMQGTKVR